MNQIECTLNIILWYFTIFLKPAQTMKQEYVFQRTYTV